jgi:hypothetical protein
MPSSALGTGVRMQALLSLNSQLVRFPLGDVRCCRITADRDRDQRGRGCSACRGVGKASEEDDI